MQPSVFCHISLLYYVTPSFYKSLSIPKPYNVNKIAITIGFHSLRTLKLQLFQVSGATDVH